MEKLKTKNKIIIVAISVLLVLASMLTLVGCAGTNKPYMIVYGMPTEFDLGEQVNLSNAVLFYFESADDEEYDEVPITMAMITGLNTSVSGEYTMTIKYNEAEKKVDYTVNTTKNLTREEVIASLTIAENVAINSSAVSESYISIGSCGCEEMEGSIISADTYCVVETIGEHPNHPLSKTWYVYITNGYYQVNGNGGYDTYNKLEIDKEDNENWLEYEYSGKFVGLISTYENLVYAKQTSAGNVEIKLIDADRSEGVTFTMVMTIENYYVTQVDFSITDGTDTESVTIEYLYGNDVVVPQAPTIA